MTTAIVSLFLTKHYPNWPLDDGINIEQWFDTPVQCIIKSAFKGNDDNKALPVDFFPKTIVTHIK